MAQINMTTANKKTVTLFGVQKKKIVLRLSFKNWAACHIATTVNSVQPIREREKPAEAI